VRSGFRSGAGFTLIELLIVLTIVGLVVGLVGGIGADRLEKAQARDEWVAVERTVRGLAFEAFLEGRTVALEGNGARLDWTVDGAPAGGVDLKHWFARPGQRIAINANGIAVPGTLELTRGNDARTIPLNAWLDDAG
jgi:prepilin-type N-terminal cleavage/methylation domain-containing protein